MEKQINWHYSQNILETNQTIGPIENTMNFALTTENGKHTDTVEKFPIYNLSKQNQQLNEVPRNNKKIRFLTLILNTRAVEHRVTSTHWTHNLIEVPHHNAKQEDENFSGKLQNTQHHISLRLTYLNRNHLKVAYTGRNVLLFCI